MSETDTSGASARAEALRNEEKILRTAVQQVLDLDVEEVVGRRRLGEQGGFEEKRADIERIRRLVREIGECDCSDVPGGPLVHLSEALNSVRQAFERFTAYTGTVGGSLSPISSTP
jgi:hypothetical protein